jgi:hypothetical protein
MGRSYMMYEGGDYDRDDCIGHPFMDPGGKSALRAGKRVYPCPTCGEPNKLTAADKKLGYQCDDCADAQEENCW